MPLTYATITGSIHFPGSSAGVRCLVTAVPLVQSAGIAGPDGLLYGVVSKPTDSTGGLPTGNDALQIPLVDSDTIVWSFFAEPLNPERGGPGNVGLQRWNFYNGPITASTTLQALAETVSTLVPADFPDALLPQLIAARDAALAAQAGAEAVGTTNDTIIASRINTPGSATDVALSASIAEVATPDSRLLDLEGKWRGILSAMKKESGYGTGLGTWSSGASTISGAVDVDPIVNPFGAYSLNQIYTYVGATPDRVNSSYPGQVCVGGLGLTSSATMLIPRKIFVHSGAQSFEDKVFAQGGTYNARLRVGLLTPLGIVFINNTPIPGPPGGGSLYRIRIDLPDAGEHVVILEHSGLTTWWNGITRDPAATVRRYTGPIGETVIGPNLDSLGEGQNGLPNRIGSPLGYFPIIFRALGILDYRCPALGETGVIADGAAHDRANGVTRFADDVLARNPQRVPFFGSQNDAQYTKAAIKAGLNTELDQLGKPPGFPLTSNIQPRSGNGLTRVRDAYKEVATERGLPFIDATTFLTGAGFVNLSVTDAATTSGSTTLTSATALFNQNHVGHPISGAGIPGGATVATVVSSSSITLSVNATATATGVSVTVVNVTGDGGNADRYLGRDGTHLSDEGHEAFAVWWLARYEAGFTEPGLVA